MNKVSVIQGNLSQNRVSPAVLHGGTVVKGRVLSKNSDGVYTVSLAGQKINVKSESPLQPGAVFSARVSITGSGVELSLVKDNISQEVVQKFTVSSGFGNENSGNPNIPPQIANLLSSLGFSPDTASLRILQFMQQIGMQIDSVTAKKVLKQEKNSDDREEKTQIALLLEEKGIKSSAELVQAVSGQKQHEKDERRKEENEKRKKQEKFFINNEKLAISNYLEKDVLVDDKFLKRSLFSCENVKSYFSQVDEAASSHKAGALTLFNMILSAPKKSIPLRHWIVLPFEWNFNSYSGNIRLLFDSGLKNLEKLIINLRNPEKNHIFALDYMDGKPYSLSLASDSISEDSLKNHLSGILSSMFSEKLIVQMKDFEFMKGFCAGDEKIASVEGVF